MKDSLLDQHIMDLETPFITNSHDKNTDKLLQDDFLIESPLYTSASVSEKTQNDDIREVEFNIKYNDNFYEKKTTEHIFTDNNLSVELNISEDDYFFSDDVDNETVLDSDRLISEEDVEVFSQQDDERQKYILIADETESNIEDEVFFEQIDNELIENTYSVYTYENDKDKDKDDFYNEYDAEWGDEVDFESSPKTEKGPESAFGGEASMFHYVYIKRIMDEAVKGGITDTEELTDVVFNTLHAERKGKPISRAETDYKLLVHQWREIKKLYVIPFQRLIKTRGPLVDVNVQMPMPIGNQYKFKPNFYRIYGVLEAINALKWIVDEWHKKHPDIRIGIGDISQKGGGKINPHVSHRVGLDADLSLNIRASDVRIQNNNEYVKKDYKRYAQAFVDILARCEILKVVKVFFFDHKLSQLIPNNSDSKVHTKHFHIRFEIPSRVSSSLNFKKVYGKGTNKRSIYLSAKNESELYEDVESADFFNQYSAGLVKLSDEGRWSDEVDEMTLTLENENLEGNIWEQKFENELINETVLISELLAPAASSAKTIVSLPVEDHLYRIRKGDSLLKISGIAYKKKAGPVRLQYAQLINRHPYNWRYYRFPTKRFTKKYFPEGIILFAPRVSCDNVDFNFPWEFPPDGRCYSLIFIPSKTDIWLPRAAEVVQPDLEKCWAAAIVSWSKMTPGVEKFESISEVVDLFSKREIKMPALGGVVMRKLVTRGGALVRWPKKDSVFEQPGKKSFIVPAGQITLEAVASELGLTLVVKDNSLSVSDVSSILKNSSGPVIVLKFNEGVGHGTVIFGASMVDNMVGEMDPFPMPDRLTGPAFGSLMSRWLPTFDSFKKDSAGQNWSEFAFLFKKKR